MNLDSFHNVLYNFISIILNKYVTYTLKMIFVEVDIFTVHRIQYKLSRASQSSWATPTAENFVKKWCAWPVWKTPSNWNRKPLQNIKMNSGRLIGRKVMPQGLSNQVCIFSGVIFKSFCNLSTKLEQPITFCVLMSLCRWNIWFTSIYLLIFSFM